MDYVREELTRQRMVLRLLLAGGEPPAERRESAPWEKRPAEISTETDFPVETAVTAEADGGPDILPQPAQEERTAGSRTAERALREAAPAQRLRNGQREERDRAGAANRAARPAETAGAVQAAPALAEAPVRTVVETVTPFPGRSQQSAADLSRAFQRDARRYDGGFSLY